MRALKDAGWVVGTFVVLGLVAGVVWWAVSTPPSYVRTAQGAVMDQAQLAKRVQADGRFLLIGLVASLGAGFALMRLRRRDPLLVVVLGALAAAGAGWLALQLGRTLGHVDVAAEVRDVKVGGRVRDTLTVISPMVLLVWPIGYLLAAVTLLWGTNEKPVTSQTTSGTMVPGTDHEADQPDQTDGARTTRGTR